ncbi:poly(U)-specific endoribonuclease-B-like [Haliotis rufescens]|uniref:poly(U)-specific endoribonuclease-B-like n=1 Tax=Haliotis rufescens TaxID=6454 RepID=UPI00201FB002|nr:poly(U)-specific endoribonuclease-B-like [Haliotis rufescens]
MKWCFLLFLVAAVESLFLQNYGSCKNRCFTPNDYNKPCQCDSDCESFNNCCGDFWRLCRGSEYGLVVTQAELNTFAQQLWDNDVNRINSSLYTLSYQGQTTQNEETDMATDKLFKPVDGQLDALLSMANSTYALFIQLLDNYELNVQQSEHRPLVEIQEEDAFWAVASQTRVMQLASKFLLDNGFIKADQHAFRAVINEMWFELYRGHSALLHRHKSSGFEHIMIGEKLKNTHNMQHNISNHIIGLNNWIQFYLLEKAEVVDYHGYLSYLQDPPMVSVQFLWNDAMARMKKFFVGTSPEFDMALYTVCGLARPDKQCAVTINGQNITIKASTARHESILQLTGAVPSFTSSV